MVFLRYVIIALVILTMVCITLISNYKEKLNWLSIEQEKNIYRKKIVILQNLLRVNLVLEMVVAILFLLTR